MNSVTSTLALATVLFTLGATPFQRLNAIVKGRRGVSADTA